MLYTKYLKRVFDFGLSFIALIILLPIMGVLFLLGMLFMRSWPFFVQERIGKGNKKFRLIKFKTMNNRTDSKGKLLPDEVRLNTYGSALRKTSLDELPELINILRGDMSIIGPRPLLPRDVIYMNDTQLKRHVVRPGLTGLAQCNGRNSLNWDEKLEMDVKYVENISFKKDIIILIKTVKKVLTCDDVNFEEGAEMDLKDWNEKKKKESTNGIEYIHNK